MAQRHARVSAHEHRTHRGTSCTPINPSVFTCAEHVLPQSLYIIDLFIGKLFDRPVYNNCMRLLASMADRRFSSDEFADSVRFVLRQCVTRNTDAIQRTMVIMQRASEDATQTMLVKNLQGAHGRLRLRDRLQPNTHKGTCMGTKGLHAFQAAIQFSSTVSMNTQLKAYMIASQTNCVDKTLLVSNMLPASLREKVLQHSIEFPDAAVIKVRTASPS